MSIPRTVSRRSLTQAALLSCSAAAALVCASAQATLTIGNNPLYLVSGKANVLIVIDNSNSMDEAPSGIAAGSNNATSKSEIARGVIRSLTDTHVGRVNMGLMAYKQSPPSSSNLHSSPYDVSFNPANYDPAWVGARASATHKRFRQANLSSPGNYIHYNVALPFYDASNQGNAYCYSNTANASGDFKNGENPASGPWDTYRCFQNKLGISDTMPTWGNTISETASGFTSYWFNGAFAPTDSDFAQGITDFGRYLTWNWVGPTWFANDAPGRGYLYVPIKDLTAAQGTAIKDKLACNVPGNPAPCTSAGIKNAGLTPIEGTLLTARDYFKGSWNVASEGYVASCYPLPQSCGKNYVVLLTDGLPSTNKNGVALANPAQALAEAAAAAGVLLADKIETYIIGFALPYGTDPSTLNTVAIAGGTDAAYNATDAASLNTALTNIFDDIFRKASSFGSVSQNSTSINTGSRIYQGRFNSTDWSGEIVAFRPEAAGTLTTLWNTSDAGHIPAAASRKVFTLVPGTGGVAFKTLTDLSVSQQAALTSPICSVSLSGAPCGQARIDWMRGDQSKEAPVGALRKRSKLLGDFISSSPYYVRDSNTLFAGANDGMLHAFNASTGDELFAFVPNDVVSRLYKLTVPGYTHEYYVDGEIAVSTTYETPGKNILVGTLGRGGKSIFALDVTSPSTFGASNVMWEFTDPDLGLVLGKPFIAKLNNGQTAVILGNGYNSTNERALLFIININTGALIAKLDTQAGSAAATNGLSSPRAWDNDGNGTVDSVYAGDLLGNLWRFDISTGSAGSWNIPFSAAGKPAPLFIAKDSAGNPQAITGMVALGVNPKKSDPNFGKRYVFFGTGRYITTSDVTNLATQSWYAVIDDDAMVASRSLLKTRSIDQEGTIAGSSVRSFSAAAANDMVGKQGWVIDLSSPVSGAIGERMIGESKLFGTVLTATSMIPSSDVCVPGGDGYVNAIDPFTGAALTTSFFDVNNDLAFNDTDKLGAAKRVVGSVNPGNNLPSDGILIGNRLVASGTSGAVTSLSVANPIRTGRIAWREVIRP